MKTKDGLIELFAVEKEPEDGERQGTAIAHFVVTVPKNSRVFVYERNMLPLKSALFAGASFAECDGMAVKVGNECNAKSVEENVATCVMIYQDYYASDLYYVVFDK